MKAKAADAKFGIFSFLAGAGFPDLGFEDAGTLVFNAEETERRRRGEWFGRVNRRCRESKSSKNPLPLPPLFCYPFLRCAASAARIFTEELTTRL